MVALQAERQDGAAVFAGADPSNSPGRSDPMRPYSVVVLSFLAALAAAPPVAAEGSFTLFGGRLGFRF